MSLNEQISEIDQVAALLARSLARHGLLCDLVSAQAGVLEHNVSVDVVVRYKRSFIASLETLAGLLRVHVPELQAQRYRRDRGDH